MKDYYLILGISAESTSSEVKRAFRKRAKEVHPDVSSSSEDGDQMRSLLKAYQVLSDIKRRAEYDRRLQYYRRKNAVKFNYRTFLERRKGDMVSQSKLVFYDLLHNKNDEAVNLYSELTTTPGFRLDLYLGWGDYMDCLFLLAEEFDQRGEYLVAYELFKRLYVDEMRKPYFKHFIDEVIDRIKTLTCFRMSRKIPPHVNIACLQELLTFDFPRKDKAFFYKKIAEIYVGAGRKDLAAEALRRGLDLDVKLPGVKKLKEKIGYPEYSIN